MEAIPHGHLMHTGIMNGDDEMMDSDYDQAVQQDDDYDIELDGAEVYSNAGDEEMKFDMGEEAITYDNDDVMLDEGEYQTSVVQEAMIITEVSSVNAPFSSIEMSTATTAGIDRSHITQPDSHLDSTADLPDTQTLSQASTQDIHADPFLLSQHVPGIVVEVPGSPIVNHQVQEVLQDTTEIAENTQLELHVETEEEVIHSSNDNQPGQPGSEFASTGTAQPRQIGVDGDSSVDSSAQSEAVLTLEKIHPIIVQFESNTLALFNSEHYLNFTALDTSQSTYPEVPSVFLLQDVSFYSKGFDELFGALREMFGATIGDDAEITMEFDGLELFLHEDNLLSKSISLSDLMDLHIRLSKQDGAERPDPLYIVLSTQARFTKRYCELLTAAGEGKGLSQVCTYSPTNEISAPNGLPQTPEDQMLATKGSSVQGNDGSQTISQPTKSSEVEETNANVQKADGSALSKQAETKEVASPSDGRGSVENTAESQEPVEDAAQEVDEAEKPATGEENGEEEDLLPAEEDEEQGNNSPIPAKPSQEGERSTERPSFEDVGQMTSVVTETNVEEVVEVVTETKQPEEVYDTEQEPHLEEEEAEGEAKNEADVEDEVVEKVEQEINEGEDGWAAKGNSEELASYGEHTPRIHESSGDENSGQEDVTSEVGISSGNAPGDFEAEGEELHRTVQDAPVIVNTVYTTRGQNFAAEELLDYEEEEGQLSPFSEIPDEAAHASEDDHGFTDDAGDQEDAAYSPATALASPGDTEAAGHPDEDSFSSATVVGAGEVHSPVQQGASPQSGIGGSHEPSEVDTEQHHIQVYQYEEETSSEFNDVKQGEESGDLGTYVVEETYEYQDEAWEGDETGDFLQEESYYTAVVDQEEYVDGQYEEQDPSQVPIRVEETEHGSTGGNYEDDEEEHVEYPEGEEYNDEGAYGEEYPEDAEEEVVEYEVFHGAKSPGGKRHREEETDAFDVQDIKRTRST